MHQGLQEKTASEMTPRIATFLHLDKNITSLMSQSTYLLDLICESIIMVVKEQLMNTKLFVYYENTVLALVFKIVWAHR